jgi:glycosyltransferase 2 family protein
MSAVRRHPKSPTPFFNGSRRFIFSGAVLLLLAYALVPQVDTLQRSLKIIVQASPWAVATAGILTILTYILAAEIYRLLLKHPVPFRSILLVQAATALTARVVPVGIGTMGLNAIFLRKQGHTLSESLAAVATNNGLGIIGHTVLLLIVAATAPLPTMPETNLGWQAISWAAFIAAALVLLITWSDWLWHKVTDLLLSVVQAIGGYRQNFRDVLLAFAASMCLSIVYALVLTAVCQAVGVILPFNQILVVYSISLLAGTITPTPGGLVGVEAGMIAGFVAYGIPADTAVAIALLYRLITYWLPILPGYVAFRKVQRLYL